MKPKKSVVNIGKVPCTVIQFNYTPPKDKEVSENRIRFIQILDKNQSMELHLDELVENVKKTINGMEENDLVTVIGVSGTDQYKAMLKGALPVDSNLKHQLDKLKPALEATSLSETVLEAKEAVVDIKCEGKTILYLSKRGSRMEANNLKINLSSKSSNKFYIISSSKEEFSFQVNDENFDSSEIKSKLTAKDVENLLYTMAYEEYYRGSTSAAIDILTFSLRDKYLTKAVMSAFTAKERVKCADTLLAAVKNKKINIQPRLWGEARFMEGMMSEGEILEESPCFLELLEVFRKNRDRFIPLPQENYKRIGKKVVDCYNAFRSDKELKLTADFSNLVFSKEKLNISVRYEIQGVVTINPRQAKTAGFKTNIFNAKIYREQTIIKDGEINIDRFQALVSKNTLAYLSNLKEKNLFTVSEKNDYPYDGYTLIEMNASKLAVLNRSHALKGDSLDYILNICYEQKGAECRQKVLNYYLEKHSKLFRSDKLHYTREQHELLNDFGLDSHGIYKGIDNKVVSEISGQYVYRRFEFGIKGFSTLPKVEDVIRKMEEGGRRFNGPEAIMANSIKYLRQKGWENRIEELSKLLEGQKEIIRKDTRILAEIKLVKALTGSWWEGLKLDSKDNYIYEGKDSTLVIKVVKKVVQI